MNILSLFSGCGGLDLGFKKAGFNIIVANEIDRYACETYRSNNNDTHLIEKDISKINDGLIGKIEVDGIICSPPRVFWDKHGDLFYKYIRIVETFAPKFILIENRKSCKKYNIYYLEELRNKLKYNILCTPVNAKNYGVAEDGERIFYVGLRNDLKIEFKFPKGSTEVNKKLTLRDVIWDLRDKAVPVEYKNDSNEYYNDSNEYYNGQYSKIFMNQNRVRSWDEQAFKINDSVELCQLHPQAPKMIKIEPNIFRFVEGKEELYRRMTVREIARIKGFPDNFKFIYKNIKQAYQMIGDATPVNLAFEIAVSIKKCFDENINEIVEGTKGYCTKNIIEGEEKSASHQYISSQSIESTLMNTLSLMYEGDKNRDASSKIRGFLYQDYITIDFLLNDDVKYVYTEFLEDIDVFYEDGCVEFVQVKYYPKTDINKKEVFTDLYYQYLRFKILNNNSNIKTKLVIHSEKEVSKPNINSMKEFVGLKRENDNDDNNPLNDPKEWLECNVHILKKKEEQKTKLFEKKASDSSIDSFIDKLSIRNELEINEYRVELMNQLEGKINCTYKDNKEILWGLAITYIQKRYMSNDTNLEQFKIGKSDFMEHIKKAVKSYTDELIVSYLVGKASETYEDIIIHNELSELQINMMGLIYQNTVKWITTVADKLEGQYKLLYTFSRDECKYILNYKSLQLDERAKKIFECKDTYILFLKYMWKIILDICQEMIELESDIYKNIEFLDPTKYINKLEDKYICFTFPEDVSSVILPPCAGSEFGGLKRKIVARMVELKNKPKKWFWENNKIKNGENYYNYSTANIREGTTVANITDDKDIFYIKCMNCIKIDEGDWCKREKCKDSIFSPNCIKESN